MIKININRSLISSNTQSKCVRANIMQQNLINLEIINNNSNKVISYRGGFVVSVLAAAGLGYNKNVRFRTPLCHKPDFISVVVDDDVIQHCHLI